MASLVGRPSSFSPGSIYSFYCITNASKLSVRVFIGQRKALPEASLAAVSFPSPVLAPVMKIVLPLSAHAGTFRSGGPSTKRLVANSVVPPTAPATTPRTKSRRVPAAAAPPEPVCVNILINVRPLTRPAHQAFRKHSGRGKQSTRITSPPLNIPL
ncbi:hypothetical protein T492DRAFT_154484 [Pavlovales sp. CCMP2436]|nr:hypothetical protein T492DRAFT_154484 [Pavlovales sp. CCMP2436]